MKPIPENHPLRRLFRWTTGQAANTVQFHSNSWLFHELAEGFQSCLALMGLIAGHLESDLYLQRAKQAIGQLGNLYARLASCVNPPAPHGLVLRRRSPKSGRAVWQALRRREI